MRICSFLPSGTEILYALGLGDAVAGVTFECDYPPEARKKPIVVNTRLSNFSSQAAIDKEVSDFMARHEGLYRIETDLLREIKPDLIVTQDLCHVCAASPRDLGAALTVMPSAPQVLSLNPHTLADVWNDIRTVGEATGRTAEAAALVADLERRVACVEAAVRKAPHRPRALCLEWLEPPFIAGHWVPEMVQLAGGTDVLGRVSEPGFRSSWKDILATQPQVVVIMACGYNLEQNIRDVKRTQFPAGWEALPAVRRGRVYVVDASSYFSRPGPRLATGVELLAFALHPDRAPVTPTPSMMQIWN